MKKFLKNSIPGALLGVWMALHLWICGYYLLSAMTLQDRAVITNWVDLANNLAPNAVALGIGLSFLLVFCVILLSFGWFGIEKKYRFDPFKFTGNTIKWALRVLLKPAPIVIIIITIAVLILFEIECNYLFVIAAWVVLPFGIFNESVVKSERAEKWWLPKWPGIGAIKSLMLLILIGWFFDFPVMVFKHIYPRLIASIGYVLNITGVIYGIFLFL